MKIGIISRWNATCGVSMHAEMIGREFIKMGHDVRIFAPTIESANKQWHHKIITEDEDYVTRCYEEQTGNNCRGGIDTKLILSEKPDLLIVESYSTLPYKDIENLIRMFKGKGRTVCVVHEGSRDEIGYELNIFDEIVIFDKRYLNEVVYGYEDKVNIIPYPCYPVNSSRRKFAEDILTFFSFGRQPVNEYEDYIKVLDELTLNYDFVYRVVRSDGLIPYSRPWLKQEQRKLLNRELYEYLHASDIHLLPKGKNSFKAVLSSTLCQCIGSLIPTVAPSSRYFEMMPENTVLLYDGIRDLKEKIKMLIEDKEFRNKIIKAAENYVEKNRCDKIAKQFLSPPRTLSG